MRRLIATLLIGIGLFSAVSSAYAQTPAEAVLSFEPASGDFTVGETITVAALLDTKQAETDEVDLVINYDKTLLEVVDQDDTKDGIQIEEGELYELALTHEVDPDAGTITFTQTSLSNVYTTADGDTPGVVARITFRTLAAGTATISYAEGDTGSKVLSGSDNVLGSVENASFTVSGDVPASTTTVDTLLMNADTTSITADGASTAEVTITALDGDGQPVADESLTVQVTQGDASVSPTSGTTDEAGQFHTTLTASDTAGTETVTASVTANMDIFASLDITQEGGSPAPTTPDEETPPVLQSAPERLTDSGPAGLNVLIAFMAIGCLGAVSYLRHRHTAS